MVVSNRNLLFQGSIFRGFVSFRECKVLCCQRSIFVLLTGLHCAFFVVRWNLSWLRLQTGSKSALYSLHTPSKTNVDTQNDGLEMVAPFKHGHYLVSIFNFWGVSLSEVLSIYIHLQSMEILSLPDIIWVVVSNIFYFHPYLGKWSKLTNIFQMGWNHQLEILCVKLFCQSSLLTIPFATPNSSKLRFMFRRSVSFLFAICSKKMYLGYGPLPVTVESEG